jgi:Protein of unknown function (DUF3486)
MNAADRNTIARELTVDELDKFIKELAALPGKRRTLAAIQKKAAALGIEVSLMSAKSFRDTTFQRHLDRLQKANQLATQVAAMQQEGAGNTLADASAAILSQQIFDLLDELGDSTLDLKKAGSIAFIISKIRQGDTAARALELKVKEYERKEAERAEKKAAFVKTLDKEQKRGGITKETRKLIDQELGALA